MAILALTTLGFGSLMLWTALYLPAVPCRHDSLDTAPSFLLVSASFAGFLTGHLVGRWIEARGPGGRTQGGAQVRGAVQLALVVFLAVAAGLLFYETQAVIDTSQNWPITWYTRCFAHLHTNWAALGSAAFCFLLGHWVWSPE